jgi:hypothetical protein
MDRTLARRRDDRPDTTLSNGHDQQDQLPKQKRRLLERKRRFV